MPTPSPCPAHLLARLKAIHEHVLELAARLGKAESFDQQIARLTDNASRALVARSSELVQESIREHRELAQRLYASEPRPESVEDGPAAPRGALVRQAHTTTSGGPH